MRLFANIISIVFHPLLMLTYGVILALSFTGLVILPPMAKLYIVGGVFASTALLPGLFIYVLVRNGAAGDLELTDRRERLLPYLIFVVSILSSLYFMNRMMMPYWLLAVLAGTCVALLIAMCVNFFWKISAHEIGAGGLLGGLMGYAEIHHLNFSWAFMILFLVAGLLGTSRIFLGKHTPMQVYAGFTLGFACTFLSSLWSYIYLFI